MTFGLRRRAFPREPRRALPCVTCKSGKVPNVIVHSAALAVRATAERNRRRHQGALVFKRLKQHSGVKAFVGMAVRAVKSKR